MNPAGPEIFHELTRETKSMLLFFEVQSGRNEVGFLKRLLGAMCRGEIEIQAVVDGLAAKLHEAEYSEELVQGLAAALLPRRAQALSVPEPSAARPAARPSVAPGAAKKPPPRPAAKPVAPAPAPAASAAPAPAPIRPLVRPARLPVAPTVLPADQEAFVADPAWGFSGGASAPGAAGAPAGATAGAAAAGYGRPRILIAEDDDRIRMVYRIKIEGAGYEVTEAADGAEAWELLRARRFDALVLDMKMPGYHGLDVLNRMREAGLELPVVVCTAYDQLADEFVVATQPRLKFLTKPVPPEAIIKGIQDLMKKK